MGNGSSSFRPCPLPHPPILTRLVRVHPLPPSSSHTGKLPYLSITQVTLFGIFLVASGNFICLHSYAAPGPLFTLDLCIRPGHRPATQGPYSPVRCPAYLSPLCLTAGLTVVGLTRGSWTIECVVGYARAMADGFGERWEHYAMRVKYWLAPGLVFLSRLHGRYSSETCVSLV